MQKTNAERKAKKMDQKNLFTLGKPEMVSMLGGEGTENLYFFTVPGKVDGFLYALVPFDIQF